MAVNGTELLNKPWETIYSPFTDFFANTVGVGNAFYLFLIVVFAFGIYIKTEGNAMMVTAFMIGSGALALSANIFAGNAEMSIIFAIFTALGIAGMFMSVIFQR